MNMPTDTRATADADTARGQAQAQANSVQAMVAALECDYDRLAELREERNERAERLAELREERDERAERLAELREERDERAARLEELQDIGDAEELADLEAPLQDDAEELADLEAAAGDCESRDDAETRIQEDALSVETRGGWITPGETEDEPEEFRIVLCCGGPHVEMRGELTNGEPSRAWLEYQDWGTAMTERCNQPGDQDAFLAYAAQFFAC